MWVELMGRDVQIGWEPCGCDESVAAALLTEAEEARDRRMEWERRLQLAGIPDRYLDIDMGEQAAAADYYYGHVMMRHNVVMCGPVGTGKTRLACYIAAKALSMGRSVRFMTSTGMLDDIRSSYDAGWNERSVVSKYTAPDVLVLDDLGQERPTEWALEMLFHIVNERNSHMRPIVATMQDDPSKLMASYAKYDKTKAYALLSRLTATKEGAQIIDFHGGDHRVQVDHG